MATAAYSTNGTNGKFATSIAWINFGNGYSLASGSNQNLSITLTDGEVVSFNLANSVAAGTGAAASISSVPTFSGSGFGNTGYVFSTTTYAAFYSNISTNRFRLDFSNITVKTSGGVTIPNYMMFFADGESLGGSPENVVFTSNGGGFQSLVTLPIPGGGGSNPVLTGLGTATVTISYGGSTNNNAAILMSTNPTTASGTYVGFSGMAFGFAVTKLVLQKNIINRLSFSDQFTVNITGTPSSSITTTGNTYGLQSNTQVPLYVTPGNTYTINEDMAPGSISSLTEYIPAVSSTNATSGGTSVTTLNGLGKSVTVTIGDYITSTLSNTFTIPNITINKAVDTIYTDIHPTTITYTIAIKNTGNTQANNILFKDTIPSSTTFVANSLNIDGTTTTANPSSVLLLSTLPAGGSTTLTFSIRTSTTIPAPNPVVNNSSLTYTCASTSGANSNSVTTQINVPILSSIKSVDKSYANLGTVLTYTVRMVNSGSVIANNIVFMDTVPTGGLFVQNSFLLNGVTVPSVDPSLGINIGSLPVGATTTAVFKVGVSSLPSPATIINTANIYYKYTMNPSIPNDSSDSTSSNPVQTAVNTPVLNVVKECDKFYTTFNDIVTYTISISNNGSISANNVILKDTIPSGTSFIANSLMLNGISTGGTLSSISLGTIPVLGVSTITFKVKVIQ